MPYGVQRLVSVNVKGFTGVAYGFKTNVADSTSTALGHESALSATGTPNPGTVFGANSPKPPKAKKFFGTTTKGFEESFVDTAAVATARTAGWIVRAGSIRSPKATKFAKPMYVTYRPGIGAAGGTVNYAWMMPAFQFAKMTTADLDTLGITAVDDSNAGTVFFGINTPKPRRASRKIGVAGAGEITVSSFISDAKADSIPDDSPWRLAGGKRSEFGL